MGHLANLDLDLKSVNESYIASRLNLASLLCFPVFPPAAFSLDLLELYPLGCLPLCICFPWFPCCYLFPLNFRAATCSLCILRISRIHNRDPTVRIFPQSRYILTCTKAHRNFHPSLNLMIISRSGQMAERGLTTCGGFANMGP